VFHKYYIYPLMPSPARLLPLTGSAHGVLGFNRWKKIWVYPSVHVNSQTPGPLVVEIATTPQQVKRSSE